MRSILEKAFVALLNEEHGKADELFHKFIVERARQIHEANRAGEDFVLDDNWEEVITNETYFTEADLADLEGDDDTPYTAEEGDEEGDNEVEDFGVDADGADAAGEELEADLGDGQIDDEAEETFDGIESLESKIDELTAKFEEMIDAIGADYQEDFNDEGEELVGDEDEVSDADLGDFDGVDQEEASVDADSLEDDMQGASEEDEIKEDEDLEDFDDLSESVIDELEKIQTNLKTDGVEIGAGKSISQNKQSPVAKKREGEPVRQKVTNHKGFEREAAPAVAAGKQRKNTLTKANSTQSKVSKEGDASAELNKLDSNGNKSSVIGGKKK